MCPSAAARKLSFSRPINRPFKAAMMSSWNNVSRRSSKMLEWEIMKPVEILILPYYNGMTQIGLEMLSY